MSSAGLELPRELARFWEESAARLEDALDRHVPATGATPAVLHAAMRHTLLAPGKRVRGVLVLATSSMLRGAEAPALELACAVEMVHAASLILDDLPAMDDATLRRGRPALHAAYGEANAILASVALLNGAFAVVQKMDGVGDRARRQIGLRLADSIGPLGLIGGQVADLEATGQRLDLERLEYVHSHKTAALFLAAVELAGLAAGARPHRRESLRRYAKNLGLAFQITDDVLGYSGSPEVTGKDAGLDRDKTTFVDLCGIDGARHLTDELIDAAVEALRPFGRRALHLRSLAEFVRSRDR